MATIDINDAYILNETGAQVDKVTGLFTKDENTDAGEKAFAQLNIGASGNIDLGITGAAIGQVPAVAAVDGSGAPTSWNAITPSSGGGGGGGRNLLDNPWFTVNQRAATTITGNSTGVFSVDRWRLYGSTTSLTVTNDGVQVNSASNGLLQRFDDNIGAYLNGKTVTVSVMDKDGNIANKSLTYSNISMQNTGTLTLGNKTCTIYLGLIGGYQAFSITTGSYTIDLRAAKLELGSVSTLANDAPPDYGEELAKCQYYFERIYADSANVSIANGFASSSTIMYCAFMIKPKRIKPSVSYDAGLGIGTGALSSFTSTAVTVQGFSPDTGHITLQCNTTGMTQNAAYRAGVMQGHYLDFSADL